MNGGSWLAAKLAEQDPPEQLVLGSLLSDHD
jgi:hypothetical protein